MYTNAIKEVLLNTVKLRVISSKAQVRPKTWNKQMLITGNKSSNQKKTWLFSEPIMALDSKEITVGKSWRGPVSGKEGCVQGETDQ